MKWPMPGAAAGTSSIWVFHAYEVFDKETGGAIDGFTKGAMSYLERLGSTIIEFKRRSVENDMDDKEPHSRSRPWLASLNSASIGTRTSP